MATMRVGSGSGLLIFTSPPAGRISEHLYIGETDGIAVSGYHLTRINRARRKQKCAGRLGDLGVMSMESLEHSFRTIGTRPRGKRALAIPRMA